MPSSNTITNKNQSTIRFNTDPSILCSIKKTIRLFLRNELRYQTESRKDTLTITSSQIETETHHVILPSKSTTVKQTQIRKTPTKRVKIIPVHSNFWNSHQLHSPAAKQQSTQQQHKTRKKKSTQVQHFTGSKKRWISEYQRSEKWKTTSLWPFAAAKWRGELSPPKVEYLAKHGLQSRSILASTKSPSLAAETSRSPDAEHPNEFPISLSNHHFLSLSLPLSLSSFPWEN